MTQSPYIAQRRGFFFVVWATSHDAPYERDRSITPQRITTGPSVLAKTRSA